MKISRVAELARTPGGLSTFHHGFMVGAAAFYLAVLPWIQLGSMHADQSPLILVWVWLLAGQALCVSYYSMKAAAAARRGSVDPVRMLAYVVGTFMVCVSGTLGGFAQTYYVLFGASPMDFDPALTPMRAAFFTWGNFSTAGSGITATSQSAQAVTIAQMAVDGFLILVALAFIVANLRLAGKPAPREAEPVEEPASSTGTAMDR